MEIKSYFFILFFQLLFLVIGHFVYAFITGRYYSSDKYKGIFIKLILGLYTTVIIYSCIKTNFKTINTGLLILPIFMFGGNFYKIVRNPLVLSSPLKNIIPDIRALLMIQPLFLFFFIWQYYFIIITDSAIPVLAPWDNRFTADLAMFLNSNGIETLNWNYINNLNIGPSPYHYFEAWTVAFIAIFSQENYWIPIHLITIPLLQGIAVIATWAIFEKYRLNIRVKLFSLLIIFISALYFNFLSDQKIFTYSHLWFLGFNAMDEPWALRNLIIYPVLIYSLLCFLEKKYKNSLLVLLALPVLFINVAPNFLSVVVILALLNIFSRSKHIRRTGITVFICSVVIFIFITTFYKILGKAQIYQIPSLDIIVGDSVSNVFSNINYTSLIMFAEKITAGVIVYLPYILISSILAGIFIAARCNPLNRRLVMLIKFYIICFLVSVFITALFSDTFGSQEFFFNTFVPLTNVFLFFLLYYILFVLELRASFKRIINPLIYIIFITVVIKSALFSINIKKEHEERYSNDFLNKVKIEIRNINPIGVKINNPDYFNIRHQAYFNPFLNVDALYLHIFMKEFSLINLSFADIVDEQGKYKHQIASAPVNTYIMNQRIKGVYKDKTVIITELIKKGKIKYLILEKGAKVNSNVAELIDKEIEDEYSGEKFIILK